MTSRVHPVRALIRGGALAAGVVLVAAGCQGGSFGQGTPSTSSTQPSASAEQELDPATEHACHQFFGDPDFAAPAGNEVLAMGANALEEGDSDPEFFASAGQNVKDSFAESQNPSVQEKAAAVAEWFEREPARGADADLDALKGAYHDLAASCAPASVGAAWESGQKSDEGTKPAALVCSHMAIQPQTFTHFRNSNVLTSNMFKLVGLSPRTVKKSDMDAVEQTNALLEEQKRLVDDEGVRSAVAELQTPFQNAMNGDRQSPGLREPLTEFGKACDAAGFPGAVELSENPDMNGEPSEEEGSELP